MPRCVCSLFMLCMLEVNIAKLIKEGDKYVFKDKFAEYRYGIVEYLSNVSRPWTHSVHSTLINNTILAIMGPIPYRAFFAENGTFKLDIGVIMEYEIPLLLPSFIVFEFAIVIPIVTTVYLCRLTGCCKRSGVTKRGREYISPTRRIIFSLSVVIASFTTAVFVFLWPSIGERIWQLPVLVYEIAHKTMEDIELFKHTMVDNARQTIVGDLQDYKSAATIEVRKVCEDVADAVMIDLGENFTRSGFKFHEVVTASQILLSDMKRQEETLLGHSQRFGEDVNLLNSMFVNISLECKRNHLKFCDEYLGNKPVMAFDDNLTKMARLTTHLNTTVLAAIKSSSVGNIKVGIIDYIMNYVFENDVDIKNNFTTLATSVRRYEYHLDRIVRQISWGQRQLHGDRIIYYIDAVKNYRDSHNFVRSLAVYGLSILTLVFLSAAGVVVICGTCDRSTHDQSRRRYAGGYRCSLFVVCYGSVLIPFVSLITIAVFLFSTHLQLFCRSVHDRSLFYNYLDDPRRWGNEYPIGKFIFGKQSQIPLLASDVLLSCNKDMTVYNTLKLASYYNISNEILQHLKFTFTPPIKSQLYNSTAVPSINNAKSLDLLRYQIQNIDHLANDDRPFTQTEKKLRVLASFLTNYKFPTALKVARDQIKNLSYQYVIGKHALKDKDQILWLLRKSRRTIAFYNKMHKGVYTRLIRVILDYRTKTRKFQHRLRDVLSYGNDLEMFVNQLNLRLNLSRLPRSVIFSDFEAILPSIENYASNVRYQLEQNIGNCGIVMSVYNAFIMAICTHGVGSLTVLWTTLALSSGLLVTILICTYQLVPHFQYEERIAPQKTARTPRFSTQKTLSRLRNSIFCSSAKVSKDENASTEIGDKSIDHTVDEIPTIDGDIALITDSTEPPQRDGDETTTEYNIDYLGEPIVGMPLRTKPHRRSSEQRSTSRRSRRKQRSTVEFPIKASLSHNEPARKRHEGILNSARRSVKDPPGLLEENNKPRRPRLSLAKLANVDNFRKFSRVKPGVSLMKGDSWPDTLSFQQSYKEGNIGTPTSRHSMVRFNEHDGRTMSSRRLGVDALRASQRRKDASTTNGVSGPEAHPNVVNDARVGSTKTGQIGDQTGSNLIPHILKGKIDADSTNTSMNQSIRPNNKPFLRSQTLPTLPRALLRPSSEHIPIRLSKLYKTPERIRSNTLPILPPELPAICQGKRL